MKQLILQRLLLILLGWVTTVGIAVGQDRVELYRNGFDFWGAGNSQRDTITPKGPNNWTVSSIYEASGDTIPATPDQTELDGDGEIQSPNTNYLHITNDSLRFNKLENSVYDPRVASDRFCQLWQTVCTGDFTDVTISFYYVNPTDAEVDMYYNLFDGNGWIKYDKLPSLANQAKWKLIEISDTLFQNKRNISFGFNWRNKAITDAKGYYKGIGIDDFVISGNAISFSDPIPLEFESDSPFVCLNDWATFKLNHSRVFCDGGVYQFWLSNENGSFDPANTVKFMGSIGSVDAPQNFSQNKDFTINIPFFNNGDPNVPEIKASDCYKVRVRLFVFAEEAGGFTFRGEWESPCFEVKDCGSYTRVKPSAVLLSRDSSVCRLTTFDVPFTSNGQFQFGNRYIAELSDENGSFAKPIQIGSIADTNIYIGNDLTTWGKIPAQIPANAKVGCGYRIRVTSSSPAQVGQNISDPFCIKACDIEANKAEDLEDMCVKSTDTLSDPIKIPFKIHRWGDTATYSTKNIFRLTLFNRETMAQVNFRPIEIRYDKDSTFTLNLGVWPQPLNQYGIRPGAYYAQITAFDSTDAQGYRRIQESNYFKWSYSLVPGVIQMRQLDSIMCKGPNGPTVFTFCMPGWDWNYTQNLEYRLFSPELFRQPTDYFAIPPNIVRFAQPPGCWVASLRIGTLAENLSLPFFTYRLRIVDPLTGCESDFTPVDTVWIQSSVSNPFDFKDFPTQLCAEDNETEFEAAPVYPGYKYRFVFTPPVEVIEQSGPNADGPRIKVRFPGKGVYRVRILGQGFCKLDSTELREVNVGDIDSVRILRIPSNPNFRICAGDKITLRAAGANTYQWRSSVGDPMRVGASIEVSPDNTTTYTVTGFVGNCTTTASVVVTVNQRPPQFRIDIDTPSTRVFRLSRKFTNGETIQWFYNQALIDGANADTLLIGKNGEYNVEVTNKEGCKRSANAVINWTSRPEEIINSLGLTISPNPYRGQTVLRYNLTNETNISIDVYDLQGKHLKRIISESQTRGQYSYSISMKEWGFTTGMYVVKVQVGNAIGSVKIIESE